MKNSRSNSKYERYSNNNKLSRVSQASQLSARSQKNINSSFFTYDN